MRELASVISEARREKARRYAPAIPPWAGVAAVSDERRVTEGVVRKTKGRTCTILPFAPDDPGDVIGCREVDRLVERHWR